VFEENSREEDHSQRSHVAIVVVHRAVQAGGFRGTRLVFALADVVGFLFDGWSTRNDGRREVESVEVRYRA